ncbi:MAG: phosphopantothenoylcysteine decarboxylase [Candidatus Omnitrophica bacterium]|nr:phosphopantothenoylcysteine decarboxylase [Candidatus Omnitrophota bacterium]
MTRKPPRKTILITAGPTIEPLDPVRFLSNHSTGRMGFELARQAKRKRYKVILISGPTALVPPKGIRFVRIKDARQMKKEVLRFFKRADCVIMTAAVSDFRPAAVSKQKIKKASKDTVYLKLKRNPDILAALGRKKGRRILVGFSLETNNPIENAREKLKSKNLDIIVINQAAKGLDPFGRGAKDVAIVDKNGKMSVLKGRSKRSIARLIIENIEDYRM